MKLFEYTSIKIIKTAKTQTRGQAIGRTGGRAGGRVVGQVSGRSDGRLVDRWLAWVGRERGRVP